MNVTKFFEHHLLLFKQTIDAMDMGAIEMLANELQSCWEEQRNVFICGNGGAEETLTTLQMTLSTRYQKSLVRGSKYNP